MLAGWGNGGFDALPAGLDEADDDDSTPCSNQLSSRASLANHESARPYTGVGPEARRSIPAGRPQETIRPAGGEAAVRPPLDRGPGGPGARGRSP